MGSHSLDYTYLPIEDQSLNSEKLDQNEELAELRADTSIEKQEMANEAREKLARMKPRRN